MNYKMIFNTVGKVICAEALFMLPALLISAFSRERSAVLGFVVTMAVMAILGGVFGYGLKPQRRRMFARDGLMTVGLTWIAVSALGALPFFISRSIPNYINCLFETVSGFTTTGATILSDIEALPKGILYWRSFTHWLGGMGVLVFILAISPVTDKDSGENMHLLRAESPGIKVAKLVPRMRRSAGILYKIYIVLTLLELAALLIARTPLYEAVNIAFSTAGTGGFAIRNDSLISCTPAVQWIVTVFMLLFGVNFNIFYVLILNEWRKVYKNEELRLYILVVVAAIVIISINIRGMFSGTEETVRAAAFQVASIISTTGFVSADWDQWPQLSRALLVGLMFIGGCAGSTAGGAKVVRISIILKTVRRALHRALHPANVKLLYIDEEVLDEETVESVSSFMLIYALIIAFVTVVVSIDGQSFATNFTAAVSCLNNVGPGLEGVGAVMNYDGFSYFSKLVLTLAMLIGRLEIYPILILFMPATYRK